MVRKEWQVPVGSGRKSFSQKDMRNSLPHLRGLDTGQATVRYGFAPAMSPSQALLRLRCGQAWLLARITQRAVHALGLVPGREVWVQVKSVAVIE